MKVRVEIDPNLEEDEVILRCTDMNEDVARMQKLITEVAFEKQQLLFYQGDKEFYFPLEDILFFETADNRVSAHTKDAVYQVKYRLYELEDLLPGYFIRVAKSTILNTHHVHAITKNITGASEVEFLDTHKHIFVSRNYYRILKERMDDRRYRK